MNVIANSCSICHKVVDPEGYFCPNCGSKLRGKPLSTSILKQIFIYLISFFLCPLGLFWGIKYIRQKDAKAKRIGIIAILITVITIIIAIWLTKEVVNYVNRSVGLQLRQYRDLGF